MVADEYHIVLYKEKLNRNLFKTYSFIYEYLKKNKVIISINENQYFAVATFYNPIYLRIFYDLDYWLYLITKKVIDDINLIYETLEYLYINKLCIYIKVIINNEITIILFNDTFNEYIINDYFKDISKNIILITSKKQMTKDLNVIKYNYQYNLFKDKLIQFLLFSF